MNQIEIIKFRNYIGLLGLLFNPLHLVSLPRVGLPELGACQKTLVFFFNSFDIIMYKKKKKCTKID